MNRPQMPTRIFTAAEYFRAIVAILERERGRSIGGFALDEKTGQWKIITPDGKVTLLEPEEGKNEL